MPLICKHCGRPLETRNVALGCLMCGSVKQVLTRTVSRPIEVKWQCLDCLRREKEKAKRWEKRTLVRYDIYQMELLIGRGNRAIRIPFRFAGSFVKRVNRSFKNLSKYKNSQRIKERMDQEDED